MRKTLAVIIILIIFSAISPCNAEEIEDGYFKTTLPDSSIYEGYFKGGLFNGHGILVWRDGSRYEGEFKDGLMNGKGILTHRTGSIYSGEFKDGLRNGKGVFTDQN